MTCHRAIRCPWQIFTIPAVWKKHNNVMTDTVRTMARACVKRLQFLAFEECGRNRLENTLNRKYCMRERAVCLMDTAPLTLLSSRLHY
ncbi:hypothetical protein T05_13577 [Trichinella murrelli]|uniref:Uncharacterized protein n=1 Tax=Trichinella murrelli TaxID=144512 RepID=A0A0V0T5Q7_9BILA|nr:hypothetical protein T05_13577 [Trichinella murrelli]